jgi:hypothetical protein
VGDNIDEIKPHLYADADFAGCHVTQRSTSGGHLVIEGPNTRIPIIGRSVRQGCISTSTPEAEIVAAFQAYKNILLPTYDMWDALLPSGYRAVFHEDNQACIRVIKSGRNPTMKHLGRVHRVSIGWLYERLGNEETRDPCDFEDTGTDFMAADIYTKAFTDPDKWAHALRLINLTETQNILNYISLEFRGDRADNSVTKTGNVAAAPCEAERR